jgi:hypothetical protein
MRSHWRSAGVLLAVSLVAASGAAAQRGSSSDVEAIERQLEAQEATIRELKSRIEDLEGPTEVPPGTAPITAPDEPPTPIEGEEEFIGAEGMSEQELEASAVAQVEEEPSEDSPATLGEVAPIIYRRAMNDRQIAAPRLGDYTLDPEFRGFIPVPNTSFLIKFNARPRVDFMGDTADTGTDFRFVPAKFNTDGGKGWRFSANANGTQLRVDVQAPSVPGDFRFFYQNDFFGSNTSNMNYRLQHAYADYYGVLGGFTFGVFEDPDAWPDTVDYEGPNSVVFARRAVLQYRRKFAEDWQIMASIEDPDIFVDKTGDPDASQRSRAPDAGIALRWTPGDWGHVRASSIFRSISIDGDTLSNDDVFGWGFNASGSLKFTKRDVLQFWVVYGRGVGGMGNDSSFVNSDAALTASGDLQALEYYSTMIAITHRWSDRWRSTATHGYVNLDNTALQDPKAYHRTHYASANVVYQVFKRLSVGVEGLYGWTELKDNSSRGIYRVQLGVTFSIFD